MKLFLSEDLGEITLEVDEPKSPVATMIVAHGAGAGMHHPFMVDLSSELANLGIRSIRFNFPYMEVGRKSPGSPKKNIMAWKLVTDHVLSEYPKHPVFLSGKSYGGRMASHLVAEGSTADVAGLVYFGFPLHAPGRDSKDRAAHLIDVKVSQLFLQGTKDKLANFQMISEVVQEHKNAELVALEEADHSFGIPKRLGISKSDMIKSLAEHSFSFVNKNL